MSDKDFVISLGGDEPKKDESQQEEVVENQLDTMKINTNESSQNKKSLSSIDTNSFSIDIYNYEKDESDSAPEEEKKEEAKVPEIDVLSKIGTQGVVVNEEVKSDVELELVKNAQKSKKMKGIMIKSFIAVFVLGILGVLGFFGWKYKDNFADILNKGKDVVDKGIELGKQGVEKISGEISKMTETDFENFEAKEFYPTYKQDYEYIANLEINEKTKEKFIVKLNLLVVKFKNDEDMTYPQFRIKYNNFINEVMKKVDKK